MKTLSGKTALVTGAAVRIGRAIAEALAAQGCAVVLHCRHSRDEADALAVSIHEAGGEAHVVCADLADPQARARLIREALDAAGSLDILVNNASVFTRESLQASTDAAVAQEFEVNLFAPMSLTRAFAAAHAAREKEVSAPAHVINILDRRVTSLDVDFFAYVMSKKALQEFTRMAAVELAPGIAVNAIAPGAILAPVFRGEGPASEPRGAALLEHDCTPEDIVRAMNYLLSAKGITGQTLYVDSGQNLLG
ncbi:MAG: NAD(P)-dependent dehydrogenase (short-subunit alcohol dehydrogenase family) [Candidatus Promineifilaceae bacterium]|jgi:pteridine reductase